MPGADLNVRRVDEEASRQANAVFNPNFNPPRHDGMWLFPVHKRGGSTLIVDLFDPAQLDNYIGCVREVFACPSPVPDQDPGESCQGLDWNHLSSSAQDVVYGRCINTIQNKTWVLKLRSIDGVSLAQLDHVEVLMDRFSLPTRPRGLGSSPKSAVNSPRPDH